jgi:Family of unknown function (DUF6152)
MRNWMLIGATAIVAMMALPASAHHGWGGQSSEVSTMTGTVVEDVSLSGPHATMKINVDGKVWSLTLAPPFRTSSAGLKPGTLAMGAKVTVQGNKSMTPGRLELKTIKVTSGDKSYTVYPERQAYLR